MWVSGRVYPAVNLGELHLRASFESFVTGKLTLGFPPQKRKKLKPFHKMATYGCFLNWWYPQNTPKWSCSVGKPMVVWYHHFRKPPYPMLQWNSSFQNWNPSHLPVFIHIPRIEKAGSNKYRITREIWSHVVSLLKADFLSPCVDGKSSNNHLTYNYRWWFQIFFNFHTYLRKISILTDIFQMGWNHQLVILFGVFFGVDCQLNP